MEEGVDGVVEEGKRIEWKRWWMGWKGWKG